MRFLVVALAVTLSLPALPLVVTGAAQPEAASLAGTATSSSGDVLANVTVQLRDLATGTVSGTTTSSSTGSFSFAAVAPGNYAVEVLTAGQVVGTSASVSVAAGAAVTGVVVSATAAAIAVGAASVAGISTIVAVTTAAAAAGVVGLVTVGRQGDASPSR